MAQPTENQLDAKWHDLVIEGNEIAVATHEYYQQAIEAAKTHLGELRDYARMKLAESASDECENGCGYEMRNCICAK
jgi:hypothetical protein